MPDFWNLGNTTVRNPERIPGALRIFAKYYDGEKSFERNEKQQGEFFEKLLNHKNDGTHLNKSDPTEIPIYNSLKKILSINQVTYNQKNGRMYLSVMNDFGLIKAYDSNAIVTIPGKAYLTHPELQGDIWLRQLLKFQIPNHEKKIKDLCIRPAYVILKLMLELEGLTKFELGLANLTKNEDLSKIKKTILEYRAKRPHAEKDNKIKQLKSSFMSKQISEYFSNEFNERKRKLEDIVKNVKNGKLKKTAEITMKLNEVVGLGKGSDTPRAVDLKKVFLRLLEKKEFSLGKFNVPLQFYFMLVKSDTIWSDYVDLNTRYLKMCGMLGWLNLEERRESRFIVLDEYKKFIKLAIESLDSIPKVDDEKSKDDFKKYLFDVNQPTLKIDKKETVEKEILNLKQRLCKLNPNIKFEVVTSKFVSSERLIYNKLFQQLELEKENEFIKNLNQKEIESELKNLSKNYKDITPTYLESLIWKSIQSLAGSNCHPSKTRNFHVDSNYESIFTAGGYMPDMQFTYDFFDEIVEVTKSKGKTQWRMEEEPVPRHVATHKFYNKKETFCIFIAPTIDEETKERYFQNSKGKLKEIVKDIEIFVNIVPISFYQFQKIYSFSIATRDSKKAWLKILTDLHSLISNSNNLQEWGSKIDEYVENLKIK